MIHECECADGAVQKEGCLFMAYIPIVVEQTAQGERSYDIYSRSFERPNHFPRW